VDRILSAANEQRASGTSRPATWRLLWLLVAMSAVSSGSLNILVPAIPGLVNKFATDPASVQLTLSIYIMGLAVAQPIFGPLSDRLGRRPVVLMGLGLATLASTAAVFAGSIAGLIGARLVQSLGASTGQTISRAIIRDLYERERAASMIGLVTSVVVFVPMMAPLVGGVLDTLFGWESIFIAVAIISAAVFLWAVIELPETRFASLAPGQQSHFRSDVRALFGSPRFFGFALCAGLGSAPFFSFLGGAPYAVIDMLGRSSAEYGLWFILPSFGFMAGNFLVARLSGRYTIHVLIWWGIAATIAGCLINIFVYVMLPGWEMATLFIPQVLIGMGNGLLLPTSVAGAVSIRPQVAGTASGLTGFIQMSIGAGAAQLSGYIIGGSYTATPMLVLMLCFGIATGVAVFVLARRA
jgi:DHA1 family bicyclomycin/chloramphenicol resistance-like MFS transporter